MKAGTTPGISHQTNLQPLRLQSECIFQAWRNQTAMLQRKEQEKTTMNIRAIEIAKVVKEHTPKCWERVVPPGKVTQPKVVTLKNGEAKSRTTGSEREKETGKKTKQTQMKVLSPAEPKVQDQTEMTMVKVMA